MNLSRSNHRKSIIVATALCALAACTSEADEVVDGSEANFTATDPASGASVQKAPSGPYSDVAASCIDEASCPRGYECAELTVLATKKDQRVCYRNGRQPKPSDCDVTPCRPGLVCTKVVPKDNVNGRDYVGRDTDYWKTCVTPEPAEPDAPPDCRTESCPSHYNCKEMKVISSGELRWTCFTESPRQPAEYDCDVTPCRDGFVCLKVIHPDHAKGVGPEYYKSCVRR